MVHAEMLCTLCTMFLCWIAMQVVYRTKTILSWCIDQSLWCLGFFCGKAYSDAYHDSSVALASLYR